MVRWSDLRIDGVDIHEVLYTGPLVYLCVFLYVQSQCELESPPLTSVEVTHVSTGPIVTLSTGMSSAAGLNKVFRLVRNGDLDDLNAFFSTDDTIDVNQVNQDTKLTPLMLACNRPSVNLDIIELLIVKGAEVDYQYNGGYSALMKAVEDVKVEVVKCLIKHGAQVDLKDSRGKSVLSVGCKKGNVEIVKVLLEVEGVQDELISGGMSSGSINGIMNISTQLCPFNTAIEQKHIELVKWLLDSYMVTDIPVGALFSAIKSQCSEMVQLLLDHGGTAQVNPTADGETSALMLASYHGNSEIVKMLLEKGAKVNLHNENEVFALTLAAGQGNVEVVKELLERRADVNLKGKGGSTALLSVLSPDDHVVHQQSKIAIVELLLEYGADVKVQDDDKHSPIHEAIIKKSAEIVKLLLDKDKVIINQQDQFGCYPLKRAIKYLPDIVQLLLDRGADPNQDDGGETPLMSSVYDVNIAKMLIASEANVNLQSNNGGYVC